LIKLITYLHTKLASRKVFVKISHTGYDTIKVRSLRCEITVICHCTNADREVEPGMENCFEKPKFLGI